MLSHKIKDLDEAQRLALVALFAAIVAGAGVWSMPPLDRDEARFAQATAQMLETSDFINIRFQSDERNKKPAGIHWLQAASVSTFSSPPDREIWAYRLPSVGGAIVTAIFTYLAGARLYGPQTGFLSALLLAAAPGLAGEATIAKTDAMLLATVCAAQAAFIHIYARAQEQTVAGWLWPLLLWLALGVGILIKGPIAPMIVGLTGIALLFRSRQRSWIAALRPITGLAILIFLVAPWAILIGLETDGRFFTEALGGDMVGKLGASQESHAGPPGYHLAFVWILLWPATALLVPGFIHGLATRRAWPSYFLLAWIIPSWIVFELTATKLPHYTLPLYPALAILAARAVSLGITQRRILMRKIGAGLYLTIGGVIAALIASLPMIYGDGATTFNIAIAVAVAAASLFATILFWRGRSMEGSVAATATATLVAFILLNSVLPNLDQLRVSPRLSIALDEAGYHHLQDNAAPTALTGYSEPSAVFLLGTPTVLTSPKGVADHLAENPRAAVIVEARMEEAFQREVSKREINLKALAVINGVNYSKGDNVTLTLYANNP